MASDKRSEMGRTMGYDKIKIEIEIKIEVEYGIEWFARRAVGDANA